MLKTVRARLRSLPAALGGLALGLAGLGQGLECALPLHGLAKNAGAIAALSLLLPLSLKYLLNRGLLREELRNPVLGCLPAAATLALMLAASGVSAWNDVAGLTLWILGILIHIALMLGFACFQARSFSLALFIPSWYLPFVGLIMAAATVPDPEFVPLARALHIFGGIFYFGTLPVMIWRLLFLPPLPAPARPAVAIMAAPASLFLAGYLNVYPEPSALFGGLLLSLAILLTFSLYLLLPGLLRLPFSPAFASYTFPLTIGATALYKAVERLPLPHADLFRMLAGAEMVIAAVVTAYVCLRYLLYFAHALSDKAERPAGIGKTA